MRRARANAPLTDQTKVSLVVNDFLHKKMDRVFDLFDADGNGVLEEADYVALAQRLLGAYNVSPWSRRGKPIVAAYGLLWERLARDLDHGGEGTISRETFHHSFQRHLLEENGFYEVHVPLIEAMVHLVDPDERGALSRSDFCGLMRNFDVRESDSTAVFDELDMDDDDRLTVRELVRAFRVFYTDQEGRLPGNRLYGWIY
jgi:Ca2+-binding EF-hand superfamily protein